MGTSGAYLFVIFAKIQTINDLKVSIRDAWKKVTAKHWKSLADSMEHRIFDVIKISAWIVINKFLVFFYIFIQLYYCEKKFIYMIYDYLNVYL